LSVGINENLIAMHAMFSETLLSSLWSSIYDLAVAKRNHNSKDYCWAVISAFYAAEHAINMLLIMKAAPQALRNYQIYGSSFNLWKDYPPLSILRKHINKALFLKGELERIKVPPKYMEGMAEITRWYNELIIEYGRSRLRDLGKKFSLLLGARMLQNYEGLIIAHFKREDIRVRGAYLAQIVEKISRNAVEVSKNIVLEITDIISKMFMKMIDKLIKENNLEYAGLALAHIDHLEDEYKQFMKNFYSKDVAEILAPINNFIKNMSNIKKTIKKKYGEITEIPKVFRRYTYPGRFRKFGVKEKIYEKLVHLKNELDNITRVKHSE